MTDSKHSTMEVFTGASKVKIGNSNISSVGRDQYNYTTHNTIVQTRDKKRKVGSSVPELSEFTEIKRGDIYKSKDGVCYSWRLCSNGKDDTEAAVYHAELNITGSFGQKKFTVKTYRGRNARKEWRRDFLRCSKDWLREVPLFGYNKSTVPSLIFCGEFVPVAHMESRMGWVGLHYIELLRKSLGCARSELWMDPTQGKFCRGPTGPKCLDWHSGVDDIIVPSDVEFLKEDVIIRHFAMKQNDRVFLYTLTYTGHFEILDDIPISHNHVLSSLTNPTITFTNNVWWWSSKGCLDKRRVMPDGARRFRLRDDRRKIQVESLSKSVPWISQASSVFHAHNITLDEDLSNYKLLFPWLELSGTLQKSKHKRQRRQSLRTPIYFIILPSSNPVYHWSFDPTGQTQLSPEMCKYLGLPFKLSLQVSPIQWSWPTKVYKHIHDYQISRKFDPKTTDFAQSLSYPIFNVIPTENRLHEIVEESEAELLPQVNNPEGHSEHSSISYENWVEDQSSEEADDSSESFLLELLFNNTEESPKNVEITELISTRQGTKRSLRGALLYTFIRGLKFLACSPDVTI